MMDTLAYLGAALANPIQLRNGKAVVVTGLTVLGQSIRDIITTPIGSRPFLRDYGSRMDELKFEPNDEVLLAMGRLFVLQAIELWEKRAEFVDMDFEQDNDEGNFRVYFLNKKANQIESFVFPFYRELNDNTNGVS